MRDKFTPGPWHIHERYEDEVRGPGDEMICVTYSNPAEDANVRLISAAPELLAALRKAEKELERIERVLPDDTPPGWHPSADVLNLIDDVIGKAVER